MLSISLLILALVFNGLVFKKLDRFFVCLATLILTTAHYWLFDGAVSFMYYGTAALASLTTIAILQIMPRSPLTVHMQIIYLAFIAANYIGYGVFQSGSDPFWYNALVYCLVGVEFIRLIVVTDEDKKYGHIARELHISGDASSSGKSGL